jgi:hypothetical protein
MSRSRRVVPRHQCQYGDCEQRAVDPSAPIALCEERLEGVTEPNRNDPAEGGGNTSEPRRPESGTTDGSDIESEDSGERGVTTDDNDCNFGGSRPWFRCPGVVDGIECGERVAELHCPPQGPQLYLCRECHNLGYMSSRKSGNEMDAARLRDNRAFAKADAEGRRPHPNNAPYSPDRPKGIHEDTFEDLVEDDEWHGAVNARLYEMSNGEHGVLL